MEQQVDVSKGMGVINYGLPTGIHGPLLFFYFSLFFPEDDLIPV